MEPSTIRERWESGEARIADRSQLTSPLTCPKPGGFHRPVVRVVRRDWRLIPWLSLHGCPASCPSCSLSVSAPPRIALRFRSRPSKIPSSADGPAPVTRLPKRRTGHPLALPEDKALVWLGAALR